ncbi:MAG: S8 family serine peptidase [Thermodesulfobacteriota bacterium]
MRQEIVDLENAARAKHGLGARSASSIIRQEYDVVLNGFVAQVSDETVAGLRAHPEVRRVVPDQTVQAFLDVSVPVVSAPVFWQDLGYRGAGTTIAVIDTGVDYAHPDLGGCLGAACKVVGGFDFINDDGDPRDDQGHGTHVAATAAGDGALVGVAPDAKILAYKVLDAYGYGSWSAVIAGINRAADPNGDGNPNDHATIISMSLGGPGDEDDPVSTAVDNATAVGVLSVIAAGNSGDYFTVGSPGAARSALTVGATDDVDHIAWFSSRGPTSVDALIKPEITAPGVEICAASLVGAFPGTECLGSNHASISGTSMATPHVAGAAALLRGLRPSLTPAELKSLLQQGSDPIGLDVTSGGAGRLDVRAAQSVSTILSPAPVNFGVDLAGGPTWTASETVTIRNLGASARTYNLAVQAGGFPAGVGTTLTPSVVTVGPGGSASISVQITVDNAVVPDSDLPPFVHSARLVATAGTEQQAILLGFAKIGDGQDAQLLSGRKLVVRDRDGAPKRRKVAVVSNDPGSSIAPPSSGSDPRLVGAVLQVVNPVTSEQDSLALPAGKWVGLGIPEGSAGYRYLDAAGVCTRVVIKQGRLTASCRGAGIGFTLDEPQQGALALKLVSGDVSYCMVFGGTVKKDTPAVAGGSGTFNAVDAPPPDSCPSVDDPASCEGKCGGFAGACYCDPACVSFGDCCDDYAVWCAVP